MRSCGAGCAGCSRWGCGGTDEGSRSRAASGSHARAPCGHRASPRRTCPARNHMRRVAGMRIQRAESVGASCHISIDHAFTPQPGTDLAIFEGQSLEGAVFSNPNSPTVAERVGVPINVTMVAAKISLRVSSNANRGYQQSHDERVVYAVVSG